MQLVRPAIAIDPRRFGRAGPTDSVGTRAAVSDDLKLFVTTFLGGFVFVSLLIA